MTYINQIHLMQKGIEPNIRFLRSLYTCESLTGVNRWFDELDCNKSTHRIQDKNMTLERFLGHINKGMYTILQIGSPDPFDIRYGSLLRIEGVRKHLFIECPYTQVNLSAVERIYEESFNAKLTSEPVPDGLLEYYEWRVRNYPKT